MTTPRTITTAELYRIARRAAFRADVTILRADDGRIDFDPYHAPRGPVGPFDERTSE